MSSVNPNTFPNVLYCLYDQRYALKGEISGEQGGIDVYAVAGTRDQAAIDYAISQYPGYRLFFDAGTWDVTTDTTFPDTCEVYTEPGTIFSIASGITVTFSGSFNVDLQQVFSYADSTCNVILNNVTEIYPEWWGAEPYSVDSSDDQSTYINYAIKTAWTSTSVTTGSKKLVRLSGLYRIDNPILIPYNNIALKGTGRYVSGLMKVTNSINGIEIYRGSEIGGANAGFVDISDMTITGYEPVSTADFIYSAPITGTNGIQVEGPAGEIYFSNLEVTKHRNHGIYCKEDDSGNGNWIVSIDKCIIMVNRGDGIRDALEIASGGNGNGLTLTNSLLWQNGGYGLTWSGFGLNATGNGFEANSYGGINLTVSGSGITSFGPANISGNYFEEQYLKSTSSITDITNASTTTVTATGHGLETGDYVYLTDIGGTTELNGKTLQITKGDDDNFSLDGIDSTNYGSYTSGGTVYPSTDDTKGCININLDDIYLFGLVAKGNMFYKGYSRVAYAGWDGAICANGTGGLLESEIGPNFFIYGIPDYHSIANISNIIKSSTTTVTALSHGFTTGQSVRVTNVGGLTEVNDETYTITKVTDDVFALNTDTSAYTATYTSGGIAFRSQEPATVDLGSLGWKGVKIHSRYSRTTSPNSYVNLGNAQVFYGIDTDINTTYTYNDTVPSSKAAKYYIDTATTSITNYLTNGFNTNEEFSTVLDLGEYSDTYSVGYITFPVGKSFLGTIDISLYPSCWYSHAYGNLSMRCSFYSAAITGSYSPSTPVSYIYEADGTLAEWYGFRPIEQDNVEGLWKIPIYHIQKVAGEKQHLYALAKVSIPTTVLSTSYNAHTLVDALDVIAPAVYTNTWTRNYVTQETLLRVQGIESGKATLELWADEGDDSTDRWSIVSETDGKLYIKNDVTTITYIDTANISATYIDRDGTLAANSDTKIPSQKAVKTYVDSSGSGILSTITYISPEYFGAISGNVNESQRTLNTTAINDTIETAWNSRLSSKVTGQPNTNRKVVYLPRWYEINGTITLVGNGIDIKGNGPYSSGLINYNTTVSALYLKHDTSYTESSGNSGFISLKDFGIIGTATTITTGNGIEIEGPFGELRLENIDSSYNGNNGFYIKGNASSKGGWVCSVNNCHFIGNYGDGINAVSYASGSYAGNAFSLSNSLLFANKKYGLSWLANGLNIIGNTFEQNELGSIYLGVPSGSTPISTWAGGVNISGNYFESTEDLINALQHIKIYAPTSYPIYSISIADNFFTGGHDLSPNTWLGMIYAVGGGALSNFYLGMNHYAYVSVSTAFDGNNMPDGTSFILAPTTTVSMTNLLNRFKNTGTAMVINNHTDDLSNKISPNEDSYFVYPTSHAVRDYVTKQNTVQEGTMNYTTPPRYMGDRWYERNVGLSGYDEVYEGTFYNNYTDNGIISPIQYLTSVTAVLTVTSYGDWVKENDLIYVPLSDGTNYKFIAGSGNTSTTIPIKTYVSGENGAITTTISGFYINRWDRMATYVDVSGISTATFVTKSLYDANTILYATSDNTPVALTVGDQTVVGRAGSGIAALAIDSDLSSASASDNTVPSAKATKTYVDAVDTLVDTLDSNLKYYTKGQVIEAVYEIVTPSNVKGLWFFNATGADITVLDKSTIGGASAHTVNLMDATGVAAEASTLSPGYYSMAPYLTFASDDYWETNDSADFTFALSPVSVFVLCNLTDATSDSLACKFDQTTGSEQKEWRFQTDASDKLTMTIWDNTAGGYIGRNCSSVVTSYEGLFTTYATTYDGGTANSGIKLYLNGAQVDDTNVSSGTFNTMQDTTSKLASYYTATTGARAVLMDGKVSFILIVAEELTAIQIRRLDNIIRSYAGYNV